MEFPEYRYVENNMLKKGPDDEFLVDLNDLYLGMEPHYYYFSNPYTEANPVDSNYFVRNQSQDSFDVINIPPSDRRGWRRWIVCDVVGKSRFSLKPGQDPHEVIVYRSLQGSNYGFHILDFNVKGYLMAHDVFVVRTTVSQ